MNAPQSNMPAAARRQVKQANAQIKAFAAGEPIPGMPQQGQAPSAPPPNLPNVGAAPPPDAVPAPPQAAAPPANPPPQAPGPSATAQPAVSAAPVNEFEQRYKVLQGKYNQEMAERNRLIQEQARLIEQMRSVPVPVAPAPAPAPTAADMARSFGVSDKQMSDFGPDLVELIGNVAARAAQQAVAPVAQQAGQAAQLAGAAVQRAAADSQGRVWEALHEAFGADAVLINGSQEFLDWASQIDIFSGVPRKVGLMNAFESGDSTRVVAMFKAFKAEEDAQRRVTADPPRTAQLDPATLLAPGQGRTDGAAAPGNASGRIWSEQEVRDFYSRVQRNRISPAEKATLEADLRAAIKDGRVRPDRTNSHLLNNA